MSTPATKHGYPQLEPAEVVTFGVFQFAGHVPVGEIAEFYGLPIPQAEKTTPVGDFMAGTCPQSQRWATDHRRRTRTLTFLLMPIGWPEPVRIGCD